jgi:hypothetical protein
LTPTRIRATAALALLLFDSAVSHAADSAPLVVAEAKPAPELDALFQNRDGWIGGDGVYSVALSPAKTLWLFSDTFVGSVRDGKRTGVTMVNNTVGIQTGRGADARVTFAVGKSANGKPAAVVVPADGLGWFWLNAGAVADGKLFVFLARIEKTAGKGAFAFKQVGQEFAVVANPDDDPAAWRVKQQPLHCTDVSPKRTVLFGCATMRVGDDLYVYGLDEEGAGVARKKHMIVARVPAKSVDDQSAWRFFRDGEWQTDFRACTRLADGIANEYSVSYLPERKCFVAVYSESNLSPRILARTADAPQGPWSNPVVLYECPEAGWDKRIFCYAAKAHPTLAGENELVVSYVANSHDFAHTLKDDRLYWPRFVRVKLRSSSP